MNNRIKTARALTAALVLAPLSAHAADMTITETGSTLVKPLFDIWASEYPKKHAGVQVTTGGVGSEAGMQQALSGQVMIGASDAYMSDQQVRQNPNFIDIALAISALTVNYNLPGLPTAHLRLDGPTIAGIYSGTIRQWDAPEIVALNPGVTLPHETIIPLHRAEGSGDTFVFSQFLNFSTSTDFNAGWNGEDVGTSITWPTVPGGVGVQGNEGMVQALAAKPYSIGYLGVSYASAAEADKVGTAMLKNEDGQFVLPTEQTILAGATSLGVRTPADERLSLVYAPGERSYPLVNYEYAVVSMQQPNTATAAALRRFLRWAIVPSETKQGYLDQVHFVPLPPHIWELSQAQIQRIR